MIIERTYSGCYDTDFRSIQKGNMFPSNEVVERNRKYKACEKLYDGSYSNNKYIEYNQGAQSSKVTNYKVMPINLFKLIINKITCLFFSGEIEYKTGNADIDSVLNKIVERDKINGSLTEAVTKAAIYGDCVCKAYMGGVSTVSPINCYKVLDKHDKNIVLADVLYEYLYKDRYVYGSINSVVYAVRFEIHTKGKIYEHVYGCNSSGRCYISDPIECEYRGRTIPKEGNIFDTGIYDCSLVSWLSMDKGVDGVYGESQFSDIKPLVFTYEIRMTSEAIVLDENQKPYLVVGEHNLTTDKDGNTVLKGIDGRILSADDDGKDPHYVEFSGSIISSMQLRENIMEMLYLISEMNKSFMSGEFSGNLSTESINNCIKGALDKVNRLYNEIYYQWRDVIYCECLLNGIDIKKEDITWIANIGRVDDEKLKLELIKICIDSGILSKETCRSKYLGYTEMQNSEEEARISKEQGKTIVADTELEV